MRIHIVQKGDTLWKLAQKYGVDFEELKAANNHLSNPDLIMPGMKIKIPSGKVQATKEMAKKEAQVGMKKEKPIAKEAPKKHKIPPPSIKEEKEAPIPMPAQPLPQVAPAKKQPPSFHLQKTNIDVNIYKQQKETEINIPVQPIKKEQPKPIVPPKPIEAPVKKPLKAEKKPPMEKPKMEPMPPMEMPMYQNCYPVTPLFQYGPLCPPNMVPVPLYQQPMMYPQPQLMHGHHFAGPMPQQWNPNQLQQMNAGEKGQFYSGKKMDGKGFGDITDEQMDTSLMEGNLHDSVSMPTFPHQVPYPMQGMTVFPQYPQQIHGYPFQSNIAAPPHFPIYGQQNVNQYWNVRGEEEDQDENE